MLVTASAGLGALGVVAGASLPPDTRVEVERTAMGFDAERVTLLVTGPDLADALGMVRDGPAVEEATVVADDETSAVCRVTLARLPPLVECVRDTGGTVRSARAAGTDWRFDLRFPDREAASRCLSADDADHALSVERTGGSGTDWTGERASPTPRQRETLARALEMGYFDVPRRVSLVELGDELGISDTAASECLRRGMATVLQDLEFDRYVTAD